ncbi:MAG TPA: DNA-processing protein DprA [Candidatus Paceibacterota bacterium]|nr:DNA-processing protein DprA [Candidatus Paceibacterota bacterium]
MNDAHYYYHAIAAATHGGYATIKKYRNAAASWEAAYRAFARSGAPGPDPEREYARLERAGIRIALREDAEFPETLRHIPHPPFALYLRGGTLAPQRTEAPPRVAIVGTRRASADGKRIARQFARELAAVGFAIASGLAFGIDAAAHEGALDAHGATVAVLAGGLDNVYPHSHRGLADRMLAAGGTLASEYPPGEAPLSYRFIERNRIMSGISRGVLIVEAPESSGALATARYAVEQNRDVFVVPGAITVDGFKGSHALIRQGAELVASPDDIFEAYDVDKKGEAARAADGMPPEEMLILKALTEISAAADVDKLVSLTKLEPQIINQALSFLLIRGKIKETDTGYTI